jgi:prevent-host-death family protein
VPTCRRGSSSGEHGTRSPLWRPLYDQYILYMSAPTDKSVSEARRDLAAVIDAVRSTHQPVWISRRGHRVAAVIDADQLERLQALAEDMADILDAEASRAEMRETAAEPVPWEQVKADLGLA